MTYYTLLVNAEGSPIAWSKFRFDTYDAAEEWIHGHDNITGYKWLTLEVKE